jgi:hypothetical protein
MPLKPPCNALERVGAFLEAQRLRHTVDDLKRFNEQSLRFLKEARHYRDLAYDEPINTDAYREYFIAARAAAKDAHEERVKHIRGLAENANDSAVRHILLSLAESYDCIEEQISPDTGADCRE